ncbi:MAG: TIGR02757 family protein [Treponema sp.]|nr:TIGR02757 family protein [Treponema sp.]
MPADSKTKTLLHKLAAQYETPEFLKEDPSQFLRYYSSPEDAQLLGLSAALLSFGNRRQFIPKIQSLCDMTKGKSFYEWIADRSYRDFFNGQNQTCFYRFFKNKDMFDYFERLSQILANGKKEFKTSDFGTILKNLHQNRLTRLCSFQDKKNKELTNLADTISDAFKEIKLVPQTKTSAKKRLCMYVRWMVRDNSPVDLGLWSWYDKNDLLIPLDVHVVRQSKNLGLLDQKADATRKTCETLSAKAREIFPGDPCKMDYALFGLGIDSR